MTIEEKAKRYDKALEKARQLCVYPTSKSFISDLQDLFPELKESEDERIRKALKKGFKYHQLFNPTFGGIPCIEIVNWLEKQGEQKPANNPCSDCMVDDECVNCEYYKPAEWSEEDEGFLNLLLAIFTNEHPNGVFTTDNITVFRGNCVPSNRIITWLKSLKGRVQPQPKQEWSEEDEQAIEDAETWLDTLCDYLKDSSSECIPTVKNVISKLKSLRPVVCMTI